MERTISKEKIHFNNLADNLATIWFTSIPFSSVHFRVGRWEVEVEVIMIYYVH